MAGCSTRRRSSNNYRVTLPAIAIREETFEVWRLRDARPLASMIIIAEPAVRRGIACRPDGPIFFKHTVCQNTTNRQQGSRSRPPFPFSTIRESAPFCTRSVRHWWWDWSGTTCCPTPWPISTGSPLPPVSDFSTKSRPSKSGNRSSRIQRRTAMAGPWWSAPSTR